MRTRLALIVCVLVLSLLSCQGSSLSPSTRRFGFVTNGVASFWVIARTGVEHAARELKVTAEVLMPANGMDDQKRMLEDLLVKGVDGIALSPIDPANQADLIDRVASQTKLITHDSDAPGTKRLAYVGMDNYQAGRMVGQLVKEALPSGGAVMLFIGRLEQDNARRRRQGVIDELLNRSEDGTRFDPSGAELKGEKFTILGTLTDQFDFAKGKANVEDTLSRYPDVAAMVGLFAYNPPLIVEALRRSPAGDRVKVVAFDEDQATLDAIREGRCYGTVVQDPFRYGYESIVLLTRISRGEQIAIPADKMILIPARQIRRANLDEFETDLKRKMSLIK